jgi:integrase/recombinase XerD
MGVIEEFTTFIQQIGYSKSSQYAIPYCVEEFLSLVHKPVNSINQNDVWRFYEYLQTRPLKKRMGALSNAMINHYIFGLRTFFSWLETTHQITHNPISNLKFKRLESNTREPLSQEEIQAVFKATKSSKEKALIHLFYSCGLRRTEAENLNIADIHFTQNKLYVREGKGVKRRVIPFNEAVKKDLELYVLNAVGRMQNSELKTDKKTEIKTELKPFMLNKNGLRMSGDSYNTALKSIVKRAGIEKEITLHHLRHSIATHLLENGLSIEFVRDFLGHTHLEATQIYTKVFTKQLKHL